MARNYLALFIFLVFWMGNPCRGDLPSFQEIVLVQGEQRWLKIPGLEKFSLGGPEVRALPSSAEKDSLLLKAVSAGHSSLWIRKRDGSSEIRKVRVETWEPGSNRVPEVWRAIGGLEETEAWAAGESVILRGLVRTEREWQKIRSILRSFPDRILDETKWEDSIWSALDQEVEKLLQSDQRLRSLKWIALSPSQKTLQGTIDDPALRKRIEKIFEGHTPKILLDLSGFKDGAQTVFFRVFLLEMKKSAMESLGLAFPELLEGKFQVTPLKLGFPGEFPVTLHAMESKGLARVLSNPELALRVPGEAELFTGGEMPMREKRKNEWVVTWRSYGLLLKLKATEYSDTKVRLEIGTEMSHLDPSLIVDEIPGVKMSRLKTQVDAKMSEALFLSGLLQEDFRESSKGLPGLSSIPILGSLFGSKDYLNERSELVAILIPHRNPPAPPELSKHSYFPKGPIPVPRNWISLSEKKRLEESFDYPWCAFTPL